MLRFCLACIALSLLFVSCDSKDLPAPLDEEPEANFYAHTIGNSWTYEYYERIFMTEEFEKLDFLEEVEIMGTSEVDGETYYELRTTITGIDSPPQVFGELGVSFQKQRDSLGYLIDDEGTIFFSSENLNDYTISENEWGDIFGKLQSETETIVVDAGTFICSDNIKYLIMNTGDLMPGRDNTYYSDGLGQILRTYSYATRAEHNWEKRLISYEIVEE